MKELFIELVQVVLGHKKSMDLNPFDEDWQFLFTACKQQAIAGLVYSKLDELSKYGQKPPLIVLYDWIGLAEQIKQQNKIVNHNAVDLCKILEKEGFDFCILKGQGNNLLYPNPYLRTSGDIDVWVKPKAKGQSLKDDIRRTIAYVKMRNPRGKAYYHHVDYGVFQNSEVEVHYRPSFMFHPLHNHKLQQWFTTHQEKQFSNHVKLPDGIGQINIPTTEFNLIFQLSHVYNHLLHEGIGLRQIIDYYYLIKSDVRSKGEELSKTFRDLGLKKIAGAMMWVLNEKLGLPEEYLIVPKDEKRGRILLAEIMRGGNFGFHATEVQKANSRFKKNILRFKRDLRMMRYFPSECIWEPMFRVYHFFWRMKYN